MQDREQIKAIAEHYGYANQKNKLVEELAELICAIARNDIGNILEELADVEIMIDQMIFLLDYEKPVEAMRRFKLERQMLRIKEECAICGRKSDIEGLKS